MREDEAAPAGPPVTRRTVLLGGLGVVTATAVGALAAIQSERGTGTAEPPAELVDARRAEQALIESIDASSAHDSRLRTRLAAVRADHRAHFAALDAAIGGYAPVAPPLAAHAPAPVDLAALRAAEQRAAVRAARTAAVLGGRNAALLASIAACEASHAELMQ
jgi:hypothetical protein